MVWYGMVWYDLVWYGMVWYGMVWYDMVWYGMVWYGMVRYGIVRYGMALRNSANGRHVSYLRLIIMWIRFRASDFGLVTKVSIIRAKSKQASCAEMVLGSFVFLLV